MSDICVYCGGVRWLPDCPEFHKQLKNLKFAYAYGAGPKRIEDMLRKEKNMDKLTITLTAPKGYEFTGEIRQATKGEHYYYLFGSDRGTVAECGSFTDYKYPILRPTWQWPEWLTAPYIAMDEDGNWYAYLVQPSMKSTSWCGGTCSYLGEGLNAFIPPPCTDWKQSLRRNPNDAS